MNKRLFVLLNPVAGHSDADQISQCLRDECQRAGVACEIYRTRGDEDLPGIVRDAVGRGFDTLAAAGGDGTVNTVAAALIDRRRRLAIIPVGTANLLARELAIPLQPEDACRLAVHGMQTRAIDVMAVGERIFLSHISIGAHARIAATTSAAAKRRFHQFAYIWSGLRELFGHYSWRFQLDIDGKRLRTRAAFIRIANIGAAGLGDLSWGEDIRLDDGRIDLCIVRANTLPDYLILAWYFIRRRHRDAPKLRYFSARHRIHVCSKSSKSLPMRGDGEALSQNELDLRILPSSLTVIVPEI